MTVTGPDLVALQVRDVETPARFPEQRRRLRRAPTPPPGAVVFATEPIALTHLDGDAAPVHEQG